jgi:membrane protein YdbS with pleckstrin-like domain
MKIKHLFFPIYIIVLFLSIYEFLFVDFEEIFPFIALLSYGFLLANIIIVILFIIKKIWKNREKKIF